MQLLQLFFFSLIGAILALHAFLPYFKTHKIVSLAITWCMAVCVALYLYKRPRTVYLLDYNCYKPPREQRCSYEACEYFLRRSKRFSMESENFMRGIYAKSGLGDETYAPPFIFQNNYDARLTSAIEEAEDGMFSSVDALLMKTQVPVEKIDTLVVTCGLFAPSPSPSSILVNRYGFTPAIKSFNIAGMGCGSGGMAIDLAARIMSSSRQVRYALVVVSESISLNWYFGANRSMLVTNCIFRAGCAAVLLTNDPSCRRLAKMELLRSLRTHDGSEDDSYTAAYQAEDEEGNKGISLKKELVRVAGESLKQHIKILGIKVLPITQIILYVYNNLISYLSKEPTKPHVPDFTTAFDHICMHAGGKAVIETVGKLMKLPDEFTEPGRMTLHRFGNTSSSMILYEFAYFEAKARINKGDKIWMLSFGTGFKVCSLVWRSLQNSPTTPSIDNPWADSIHRYPMKTW